MKMFPTMWCLKMVACTKRSCDLRVSLFDLVIFASENGPKVVEAAWAFWADILLVPARRLHDAAVQAAGWQQKLQSKNLLEMVQVFLNRSTSFCEALSNRLGEISFVMLQLNHMPHNHCRQAAEPCLCNVVFFQLALETERRSAWL